MATYTTNYNLKKPATTDNVSIADINGNMDAVDAALKAADDAIARCAKLSSNNTFTESNTFNKLITGLPNIFVGRGGSNTEYVEIYRTPNSRQLDVFISSYDWTCDLHATLNPVDLNANKGYMDFKSTSSTDSIDGCITYTTSGSTSYLSIWLKSPNAFGAYLIGNRDWRNAYGLNEGYTVPLTVSTDPRTPATRYFNFKKHTTLIT